MDDPQSASLRVAPTRTLADEWALVLASQGLHPRVTRHPGGFSLDLPEAEHSRAALLLGLYERENAAQRIETPRAPPPDFVPAGAVFAFLLAFYARTGPRDLASVWFERGSADAAQILAGEYWRAATALTLHSDLAHVVGNALAGTVFVGVVFGALGRGLGGALVLASGVLGNLANALFRPDFYTSVGASTSIFGAVGILASLAVARHWRGGIRGRRALAPVAAGLGLLAMLGTGARSDLSGHLFGLLVGSVLGILAARFVPVAPGALVQSLLALGTLATVLASWARALP